MKRQELNEFYKKLDFKAMKLAGPFNKIHGIFNCKVAYFNGHYSKNEHGDYEMDFFPIPVISIENYCDIEIGIDGVSLSAKLKREEALKFDYMKLRNYKFEAYGVEDYLNDFYVEGNTFEQLISNIRKSKEKEIGFAFYFSDAVDGEQIYDFVKFLRKEGFYY